MEDRIGEGLKQLMAGTRKFKLDLLKRDDIAALTEYASKVTGVETFDQMADRTMAVAAHPDFRYAKVRYHKGAESDTVIVLESLVDQIGQLEGWEEIEVLQLIEGDDLVGLEYIPPLYDEVESQRGMSGKWVHKVIPSKTVEADMTGLVHIAPGHGPEDFELGKEFGLEPYCPVDEGGKFTKDVGARYYGMATRGLTGARHFLLGSVAEKVIRFASCPVMVVRPREKRERVL